MLARGTEILAKAVAEHSAVPATTAAVSSIYPLASSNQRVANTS